MSSLIYIIIKVSYDIIIINFHYLFINLGFWNLDEALEHFGFKRRPDDAYHDAIQDARLAA